MLLFTSIVTTAAFAYQPPNSILGGGIGYPSLVSGRGEAWFADEVSLEVGAGALGEVDPVGFDAAFRWRPDLLCLACDQRALVTFGIGLGGLVTPPVDFEGPWSFAAGPDLAATAVYWFSPVVGLALSARGGLGLGWTGDTLDNSGIAPWGFGSLGLAF